MKLAKGPGLAEQKKKRHRVQQCSNDTKEMLGAVAPEDAQPLLQEHQVLEAEDDAIKGCVLVADDGQCISQT